MTASSRADEGDRAGASRRGGLVCLQGTDFKIGSAGRLGTMGPQENT